LSRVTAHAKYIKGKVTIIRIIIQHDFVFHELGHEFAEKVKLLYVRKTVCKHNSSFRSSLSMQNYAMFINTTKRKFIGHDTNGHRSRGN
jgi:hypothetical protein